MYSSNHRSFLENIPVKALAGTAVVAASYVFYQNLVVEYGWEGALRYVWEGAPYPPRIQKLIDTLKETEGKRSTQEARMNVIEEALERARLDSVDDASEVRWLPATKDRATKAIILRWIDNYKPRNLEIALGDLSASLDKLAAQTDGVILSGTDMDSSLGIVQEIKKRKKVLSKQLVLDMERCDTFMTCYKLLKEK